MTNNTEITTEATREGFGRGLLQAAINDERVVGLCADLTESTKMDAFAREFPHRFVQVGVAEQNLVTVASGLAAVGKIPFAASYAAFSPGRNWEQIRTTICYNHQPVKIVGSHVGLGVGPDGATHQMLEDIALMRTLPGIVVVSPCDSIEAEKATLAIAQSNDPTYLRLHRDKTPIITKSSDAFVLGKAQVLRTGSKVTLIATGPIVAVALGVAEKLDAEVINVATIKPFDTQTILKSVAKTGKAVTIEDHQIVGGLGGLVAETLSEHLPSPLLRLGVKNRFGQSGEPDELRREYGLDEESVLERILGWL